MVRKIGRVVVIAGALAAMAGPPGPAHAAFQTTTFPVQITILDACSIVSATAMDFGTVGILSAPGVASTSTITVICSLLTPYTIALSPGAGPGATTAARKMVGPDGPTGPTVTYSLYQDVTRLLVWGTTGLELKSGIGSGATQAQTVYGYVPAQMTPPSDVYTDTITVTLTY